MAKKMKYQLDERKFIYVEVKTEEEIVLVTELNRDMEMIKFRERQYRKRNISLDQLFHDYELELMSDEPSVLDKMIEEEKNELIREAVYKLPTVQKIVIYEHFWNEKSLRQIARDRNVSITTVRESYHSAMAKLAVLLKDLDNY